MKKSLTIILLILLVSGLGGVYWYQSSAAECPVPLYYRVGTIDESFSITMEEAKLRVAEAVDLWESATNRDLFIYDENADIVVDFVFDDRQETANSEAYERHLLDAKKEENEKVLDTVVSLQSSHIRLHEEYRIAVEAYEQRLRDYNQRVQKYNDQGGAPSDVYKELESERVSLDSDSVELQQTADKLNDLAEEINELGNRGNQMVEKYNQQVEEYNAKYGFSREFTQGDYQQGLIHIYKFSSTNELVTVLAHELGHALGINHVEGTSSVMYYLLEDTDDEPVLSVDDLATYYEVCGATESHSQKARRVVKEFIKNLFL